jgi:iron(III) transport system substrate-binding protein
MKQQKDDDSRIRELFKQLKEQDALPPDEVKECLQDFKQKLKEDTIAKESIKQFFVFPKPHTWLKIAFIAASIFIFIFLGIRFIPIGNFPFGTSTGTPVTDSYMPNGDLKTTRSELKYAAIIPGEPLKKITVYTTLESKVADSLFRAFTREHSVYIEWRRLSTYETVLRLEKERNNPWASIWVGGVGLGHILAKQKGLTRPFTPAVQSPFTSHYKDREGYWTGIYIGFLCFIINTEKLTEHTLKEPISWKDLGDPVYKDHIQMAFPGLSGTAVNIVSTLVQVFGEEGAFYLLKQIDGNVKKYNIAGVTASRSAALGDVTIAVGYAHDAYKLIDQGYPLKVIIPEEGTGYEIASISLVKNSPLEEQGNAELLYTWLLGEKATTIYEENFLTPLYNGVIADGAHEYEGIRIIQQDDIWISKNSKRLIEKWNSLIYFDKSID